MKVNANVDKADYAELRKIASGAGIGVGDVVSGLIKLYLAGRIKQDKSAEKFIQTVMTAARIYEPFVRVETAPIKEGLMRAKANGVRIGRPPHLTEAKKVVAKKLREQGMTFPQIGKALGVDHQVARRACI